MRALAFELPEALEAREPPEARGLARDEVRLMVATRGEDALVHARFRELPSFLAAGDLLVVNTSGTLPAAVPARRGNGSAVRVHFATRAPHLREEGWWVVELRSADGADPLVGSHAARAGERIALSGGAELEIVAPYASGERLLLARLDADEPVPEYLARHGEPIRYGYVTRPWPLEAYQTAYATAPGSAEMPSAGRPFTPELITELVAGGVLIAPVTLHTGVSSPERHESPYPERYEVPPATARLINAVRGWGGRVIAVGTTVVRAVETVAEPDGTVRSGSGWTGLIVTPERGLSVIDGLLTGWHEPEASHLQMLEAVAGAELLARSYRSALEHNYLWHEFGDSQLILR
ncbi:MAG: S-adenosylmethionine:tRNA ribosyltransferase-isomerase [Actinomycetota bacterium]|nr:S-adenosylmethionine:tRNA ribosyltransferase-isomerase [Actinomycetota bacterium]